MLILEGNFNSIKNSKFYDDNCWDYPADEENLLKEDENYSDVIYLKSNNRIYETYCVSEDLDELLATIDCKNCFKYKDFYCLKISEKNQIQADIFINLGNELRKIHSMLVPLNTSNNEIKELIDKFAEDFTIENEEYEL